MDFRDIGIDTVTPKNAILSAKYKRSFAYTTVKDRLPVTATKIIDHLVCDKEEIIREHNNETREELKSIIGALSKLRNEIMTDKPFILLRSDGADVAIWNEYLEEEREHLGETPSWYNTSWLYAECYFYRRLHEVFELSTTMKGFDPFQKQKQQSLYKAMDGIGVLADHVLQYVQQKDVSDTDIKEEFQRLIQVTLWGNQYDLSRPIGSTVTIHENSPLSNVTFLHKYILVDDSEKIWSTLKQDRKGDIVLDFVNDNAGYELFTDLCLADFLCTFSLADKVRFHLKALPWFISDTTQHDFKWLLETLAKQGNKSQSLPMLVSRWNNYLEKGKWTIHSEDFWTLPFDYSEMKTRDSGLYDVLSEATLVIFKGDLNYRKLLCETNWPPTDSFNKAVKGFHPAPLVALRTAKADLICGLKPGQAEINAAKSKDWLTVGDYAVIQFDGK